MGDVHSHYGAFNGPANGVFNYISPTVGSPVIEGGSNISFRTTPSNVFGSEFSGFDLQGAQQSGMHTFITAPLPVTLAILTALCIPTTQPSL